MKKIAIVLFASAVSCAAHADAWHVVVTANYMDSRLKLVQDVPVLDVTVKSAKCFVGDTRTTQMVSGPAKSTEKMCVSQDGDRTVFEGFVFPKQPITDLPFSGERGAQERGELSYGVPVSASLIGRYLKMSFGHYILTATRDQ
jgi:hypothetical protein